MTGSKPGSSEKRRKVLHQVLIFPSEVTVKEATPLSLGRCEEQWEGWGSERCKGRDSFRKPLISCAGTQACIAVIVFGGGARILRGQRSPNLGGTRSLKNFFGRRQASNRGSYCQEGCNGVVLGHKAWCPYPCTAQGIDQIMGGLGQCLVSGSPAPYTRGGLRLAGCCGAAEFVVVPDSEHWKDSVNCVLTLIGSVLFQPAAFKLSGITGPKPHSCCGSSTC